MPWPAALERQLKISLQNRVPLAPLTTWKAGGEAEFLLAPREPHEAYGAFAFCQEEGIPTWRIGGGSNILVHPAGLAGLTLWMGRMDSFSWAWGDHGMLLVEADAGCPTRRLLNFCLSHGFSGLEFTTGIHGSIGGALMCNAGAGADSMGQSVEWVESVERDGSLRRWDSAEIRFDYRFSSLASEPRLVTRCCLKLEATERLLVREKVLRFWSLRKGQPHGAMTAGCVFKNPGLGMEPAGLLLDRSGCKELAVGNARVSPLHANFVENIGSATASDIWDLICLCRQRVYETTGVWLELEVNLLGGPWE